MQMKPKRFTDKTHLIFKNLAQRLNKLKTACLKADHRHYGGVLIRAAFISIRRAGFYYIRINCPPELNKEGCSNFLASSSNTWINSCANNPPLLFRGKLLHVMLEGTVGLHHGQ
jgi:hypothetical protein